MTRLLWGTDTISSLACEEDIDFRMAFPSWQYIRGLQRTTIMFSTFF